MKPMKTEAKPPDRTLARKRFVMEAFDRYEPKLTAYAMKFFGGRSGNVHAARDAVQFTFLKLCQQDPRDVSNKLAPWLYTVCRNRIFDELKSNQRRPQLNDSDMNGVAAGAFDPAQQLEIDDFLERLPQLLETLSTGEQEVVELWSHGLKPTAIAEVIDKPAGSVRVTLHRGIKKLQNHPEVSRWLERATSQDETVSRSALNGKAIKTTSVTGEEK